MLSCRKGVILSNIADVIEYLKKYLSETLHLSIETHPWKDASSLPFFLLNSYKFYECSVLGQPCIFIISNEPEKLTPGTIDKHYAYLKKLHDIPTIFVQSNLSSYDRKRLIEYGIPFIIPGNQMYLPQLGIDLREHFRKDAIQEYVNLSPAAQAVVIHLLEDTKGETWSCSKLAKILKYSKMTITRTFHELKGRQIGTFSKTRRELSITVSNKKALWNQATPYLKSPLIRQVWLEKFQPGTHAGLTALSLLTSLAPPALPTIAISKTEWDTWKKSGLKELPDKDEAEVVLEIWHYDPALFAKDNIVDPFSLFLSLKSNRDERVESALKEMMENIKW